MKNNEEKENKSQFKSYSLNVNRVENIKDTLREYDIFFSGDANAIRIALNYFLTDFKRNKKRGGDKS